MRVRTKINVLYQLVRILQDPSLDASSFLSIGRLVRTTANRLRSDARMDLLEKLNTVENERRSAGMREARKAGLTRATDLDDYHLFYLARLADLAGTAERQGLSR